MVLFREGNFFRVIIRCICLKSVHFTRNSCNMSTSCKRDHEVYDHCDRSTKLAGKRWEYPIPKSKKYWEKFCDNEEKKLIVVRNPFQHLSYHSFPKNRSKFVNLDSDIEDKASNCHSSSDSRIDPHDASDNSLHNLLPLGSKLRSTRNRRDTESLPRTILKTSYRAAPKAADTTSYLATPSEVVRIPKLDTQGPQPSFRKTPRGKVDHIRTSFSVQNEPKLQGKSSSTLPILGTYSATTDPQLTLKKLREHLGLKDSIQEKKESRIGERSRRKITEREDRTFSADRLINRIKKDSRKTLTDEESLKYSARFAYKALKRVTKNKNLDFKLESTDRWRGKSFLRSYDEFHASVDEKESRDTYKRDEESSYMRDIQTISEQKSLEDAESSRTDVESARSRSNEETSRTILTESRYTSGPSPEFAFPDTWEGPSSRVLSAIPKLSCFPRKNRDRCLACMYKPFETPVERKVSLPRTALQRIIDAELARVASPKDSFEDSDSSSISVPSFENEAEEISIDEVEARNATADLESNVSECRVAKEAASSEKRLQKQLVDAVEQESAPGSECSRNAIAKRAKEDRREDDATRRNLGDAKCVTRDKSAEEREAGAPTTFRSDSSDEGDSIAVSISDNPPKSKYLVPCHAPTNFRPSLEPLRALRNRKATTLQDRIAFLESTTSRKASSLGGQENVQEKPRSVPKEGLEKRKTGNEERPVPPLTKAKSVLEKLTPGKAEADAEEQRRVLRKETSFSSFSVPTEPAPNSTETYRDASKDALRELDETRDDGLLKTPFASDPSVARAKLPLTRADEVMEILETLEENASSTDMLNRLCKEFSERLSKDVENDDSSARNRNNTIANLTRLLVDSKRYLHPYKYPSHLAFSTDQPPACNTRLLRRVLGLKTYNLVAPLLGMPEVLPKIGAVFHDTENEKVETRANDDLSSTRDSLLVHPPTPRDSESLDDKEKVGRRRYNPYALFLVKPRRKVVTWRPLTKRDLEGYDPDATLEMRADNSMKRICQDFCQWVETLGGTDNTIDEEVLRDMFEIDFSADACRATQVSIQEMPVVPTEVALTRNRASASRLATTKKHVMRDAKAEERAPEIKAFGTTLPRKLRFVPPNNQVRKKWLQCENVPRDIETMEVVWKDIMDLRSVRGFVEWLQQHPEVPRPQALKEIVSMDVRTLRQTEDDEKFAHLELDINQIKSLRVAVNGDEVTS